MAGKGATDGLRALVIQNFEVEGLGLHERFLVEREIPFDTVHAYLDQPLPDPDEHDLVIVGGTPVCVRDCGEHAFLASERRWLERRAENDLPTLGICFGSQLLASVLGGDVRRNPVMEIGGYEVRLTAAGETDPLLRGFPATFPVFHWHRDTFDLPDGSELLVEGEACRNQLFRHGNLVGVQFHVEITVPIAERWTVEYAHELAEVGKTAEQVVEECRAREETMGELASRFMDNLLGGLA